MLSSLRSLVVSNAAGPAAPKARGAVQLVLQHYRAFSAAAPEEATFRFRTPFQTHECEGPQVQECTATKDDMLKYYKTMMLYRRVEIVADTLYKQRKIRGFCHLYDGQEAITVGMEAGLKPGDSIITAYRDHCTQMGRGDSATSVLAELLGKEGGCSKGKGGSMHMYLKKNNFYGGNGIVGAQVPVGAGIALAHKYNNDGGVCVAMYGDGAANQGQVFEAANMAALWKLPVIFLCENNHYGMGTSTKRATGFDQYYKKGSGLAVPGILIDGMDVLAVRTGLRWAADFARKNGPIFAELSTYRYHGHSMSDPGVAYRTREEVDQYRNERDCIELAKNRLLEHNWITKADIKTVEKDVRTEVDEAVKAAEAQQELPISALFADIYKEGPGPFVRYTEYPDSLRQGVKY